MRYCSQRENIFFEKETFDVMYILFSVMFWQMFGKNHFFNWKKTGRRNWFDGNGFLFFFNDWLIVAAPWQMINSPVVGDYLHGSEAFPGLYPQVFDGLRDCCNSLEILGLKTQSQSSLSFACSLFLVHEENTFSKNEDMTLCSRTDWKPV